MTALTVSGKSSSRGSHFATSNFLSLFGVRAFEAGDRGSATDGFVALETDLGHVTQPRHRPRRAKSLFRQQHR